MELKQMLLLPVLAWILFVFALFCIFFILPVTFSVGTAWYFILKVHKALYGVSAAAVVEELALKKNPHLGMISRFLTANRGPVVIALVLPMSIVFDAFCYMRNFYIQMANSAPSKHRERVQAVQDQVKKWRADGAKKRMVTGRAGWEGISPRLREYKKTSHKIFLPLMDVLEVDEEARTVRVEPLVTMGQLSHTLLPRGWTIPCLPEMDDLTVGGLVCGCGIEASSHKYGLFQSTCIAFEVVLSDGSVVTCSKTENPDLFDAIPWSYGTLGFLVSATIAIIPAKKWVRLEYHPCHTEDDLAKRFIEESNRGLAHPIDGVTGVPKTKLVNSSKPAVEFVEALVYNKDQSVLMLGDMVDEAPIMQRNYIALWFKPWFYHHVASYLTKTQNADGSNFVEYIPLREYYHRHTKSIFWELSDIIPGGHNVIFRWLFGWMVPPKVSFLKLTQTEAIRQMYEDQHVIQDMLVPVSTIKQSLKAFRNHFDLYPLWVCPMRLPMSLRKNGFVKPTEDEEMFVDLGAYGVPAAARRGEFEAVKSMRAVEEYVRDVKGFQMLYADCYMSREEFESMFDHTLYHRLRKELKAVDAFPEVYDKIVEPKLAKKNAGKMADGNKKTE